MKVIDLPSNAPENLPNVLRDMADAIEEGHFGKISECVMVTNGDQGIGTFGIGTDADGPMAYFLLGCGQQTIMAPVCSKRPTP